MTVNRTALLGTSAAVLVVAFVVAPGPLAGRLPGGLGVALRDTFAEYWRSGDRDRLQTVVDYWFRYHLVKGAIAALLLIVLVALGVVLWRAFLRSGGAGRAMAGVSTGMLALLALAAVMANIQGAVAPFASLLPMAIDDRALAGTLAEIRQRLAEGARTPAALEVMVDDFGRYHVAVVVIAAVVAVTLIGASVAAWIRFPGAADRRGRWVIGSFGAAAGLLAVAMVVLAVANTTVATDPAPAFLALVDGGW